MTKILHGLKALRLAWRQFRCSHVKITLDDNGNVYLAENLTEQFGPIATGEWGEPEPHPVPRFAERVKIQRQPIASISHCFKCGAWMVVRGHNQRDVDTVQQVISFPK